MPCAGGKGRCRIAFAWPALVLTLIAAHQPAGAVDRLDELRGQALARVNESRREHGLPSLQKDEALIQAAQRHAEDMLREGYFSHVSPSGKTIRDRYVAAGSQSRRDKHDSTAIEQVSTVISRELVACRRARQQGRAKP